METSDNGRVVDRVSLELDTIRLLYDRLRAMPPEARVRVFRYVEALLSEEP